MERTCFQVFPVAAETPMIVGNSLWDVPDNRAISYPLSVKVAHVFSIASNEEKREDHEEISFNGHKGTVINYDY